MKKLVLILGVVKNSETSKKNSWDLEEEQMESKRSMTAEKKHVNEFKIFYNKKPVVSSANFDAVSNNKNSIEKRICKGDISMNGSVASGIGPFLALKKGLTSTMKNVNNKSGIWLGDFNGDSAVTFSDIDLFVETFVGRKEFVYETVLN